jgi:hypothetical protein
VSKCVHEAHTPNLLRARRRSPRPVQGILYAINETLALQVKGFVQESDRSRIHRYCSCSIVRVGRYEDHRYIETQMRQTLLQLEASHVRHLHVRDQTASFFYAR